MMAMADNSEYLPQLQAEKDNLDPSFVHAGRLLVQEIDRVQTGGGKDGTVMVDVTKDKPVKLQQKVLIPIKEYPKFNFVGKLLGPKGNSLKRLQEETGTKMAILGRGSMRDKNKEEELRKEGGKYSHLNDELHVLVEVYCEPGDGHSRLSHALTELRKYLTPQEYNDEIRMQQFEEMMYLNGEETGNPVHAPRGRGGRGGARGAPGQARGAIGGALLATPPGRGAHPPARGGATPPVGRGARGGVRGAPPRGRGAYGRGGAMRPPAEPLLERYHHQEESYTQPRQLLDNTYPMGAGNGGYEETGYDQGAYGDPYDQGGYSSTGGDTQYFDYGHGSGGANEAYEDYGDGWGSHTAGGGFGKAPPPRKPADLRAHPYPGGGRGAARY